MIKKFISVLVLCLAVFVVSCSTTDPTTVSSTALSTYIDTLATLNGDSIQITDDSADDVTFSSSAATTTSSGWDGNALTVGVICYNIAVAAGYDTEDGIAGVVVTCDGSGDISSSGGASSDGVYTFTLTVVASSGYVISSSDTRTTTLTLTVS